MYYTCLQIDTIYPVPANYLKKFASTLFSNSANQLFSGTAHLSIKGNENG